MTPERAANTVQFAPPGYRALMAMGRFLAADFQRTGGQGSLRTIVRDVELGGDGTSTDPAALSDWAASGRRVLDEDARR